MKARIHSSEIKQKMSRVHWGETIKNLFVGLALYLAALKISTVFVQMHPKRWTFFADLTLSRLTIKIHFTAKHAMHALNEGSDYGMNVSFQFLISKRLTERVECTTIWQWGVAQNIMTLCVCGGIGLDACMSAWFSRRPRWYVRWLGLVRFLNRRESHF